MATAEETKKANMTRAQKAKQLKEENDRERKAQIQLLKAEYLKMKDSPVLQDIIAKANQFANYHIKISRDAVGADADGNIIYFTNEKRVSELDRSAGNLELVDYIDRMIDDPAKKSMLELDIEIEETVTENSEEAREETATE